MKSVGNLTDFVRSHMLEPFDVAARITALLEILGQLLFLAVEPPLVLGRRTQIPETAVMPMGRIFPVGTVQYRVEADPFERNSPLARERAFARLQRAFQAQPAARPRPSPAAGVDYPDAPDRRSLRAIGKAAFSR